MDERIESMGRDGADLLADYVSQVAGSSAKFLETLLGNVETLVRGVIREGVEVVHSATAVFLDDEEDDEPTSHPRG